MTDHFRSPAGAPTTNAGTATLRPRGATESITLLVNQPLKLGRGSADPVVGRLLSRFGDVSRDHAEVTLHDDGTVVIVDIESQFGTFVRGERLAVQSRRRVQLPVEIRLGDECYLTLVGDAAAADPGDR
jgi:pSer/pThr/pTyr-binding forkhead associated (FHA) protein